MAPNDGVDIGGTVRERAARELRDRILTGALPAGTRLDLDAITKEFATSRTPVREALLELSYDGLVRVAPRSGITVIGMSPEDVLDSFTILGVLTGQAAAWAAERVTDDGIERLRTLATDVEAHAGEGAIVDANWHFHREIHRASHSRRLMAQIRQAVRVVPSNFFAMFPEHEHNALDEHEALVSALADRDADKARHIAERHVLDAGRSLADWLKHADPGSTINNSESLRVGIDTFPKSHRGRCRCDRLVVRIAWYSCDRSLRIVPCRRFSSRAPDLVRSRHAPGPPGIP